MPLFSRKREIGVQSFVLKLVNNNCPELKALTVGPRLEERVNLTAVALIIPVESGQPRLAESFFAVTKEFSTTGVAVVLDHPRGLDEVFLGFRFEGEMTFVRAQAKHLNPMGGGFHQLGFRMTEMVHRSEYPELQSLCI